jgi:ATP synthase protein I
LALSEHDTPNPLKDLGRRLDTARRIREEKAPVASEDRSFLQVALGLGFRIGVEMVAAIGVGLGIGWLADRGLGTKPWGMVLFLILGAAAGIMNVFRSVTGRGYAVGYRRPENDRGPS